jgi:cell wall-associated NlpC family hydrolase
VPSARFLAALRPAAAALAALIGLLAAAGPAQASPPPAQLRISPHHEIDWSRGVRVVAALKLDGRPVPGYRVAFYYRSTRSGPWRFARWSATNRRGYATLPQRSLKASRQYRYAAFGRYSSVTTVVVRSLGQSVVDAAAAKAGAPYVYGAAGPDAFDCSGLTRYVWSEFGFSLPHNAAAQYELPGMQHIAAAAARPGDFVFFGSGGSVYHVGIYAGHGEMWDAPDSGDHVRLRAIFSGDYTIGRLT